MSIVASEIVHDSQQVDGRRRIIEQHTDHLGQRYYVTYLLPVGGNATTEMTSRVLLVEQMVAEQEFFDHINR